MNKEKKLELSNAIVGSDAFPDDTTPIKFKNILLTTDLSPNAEAAVPYAVAFAKQSGGTIHVFHAFGIEPEEAFASGVWAEVSVWLATARTKRQEQVAKMALRLSEKTGLNIAYTCEYGQPALETVKVARTVHANLIVLSTHGRTGSPHFFLGSVAEKIVRLSPIPVLTVRPFEHVSDELTFKIILVPTDFSENAKAAMFFALRLAKSHGAKLILAHVVENATYLCEGDSSVGIVPYVNNWTEFLKSQGEKHLAEAATLLASKSGGDARTVLRYGRADEEICKMVREFNADLVVMSTHGYTGFSHLAFGTVTERVMRSCPVPMLSIRSAGHMHNSKYESH